MSGPIDKSKGLGNELAVPGAGRAEHKGLEVAIAPTGPKIDRGHGNFDEMLAVVPAAIEGKEAKKSYLGRAMDFVTSAPAAATKAMEAGAKLWDAAEARSVKAGAEATKELAEAGTVLADLSKSVGLDKVAEKSANLVKQTMSGGLYTKGKLKAEDLTKEKLLEDDLLQNLNERFEKDTVKTKEKGSRGMLAGAFGKMARALSADETARKNLTDKLAKNAYAVRALDLLNKPRRSKVEEVLTKAQIDAKPNAADIRKFLGLAPADKRDYQLLKMKSGDYFFVPTAAKEEGKEVIFFEHVAADVFNVIPLDGSTPPTRPRNTVVEASLLWAWGEGEWETLKDPAHGEEKVNKQKALENELAELAKKLESLTVDVPTIAKNLADVETQLKDKKLPNGHKQALTEMQKHLDAELKVMNFNLGQTKLEMDQLTGVLEFFAGSVAAEPLVEPPMPQSGVVIEPVDEEEAAPVVPEPPRVSSPDLPPAPSIDDLPAPVLDDLPPPPPPVVDVPVAPAPPAAPPMPVAPPAPPAPPVMPAAPAPTGERGALLDAIRKGKTLRKKEESTPQPKAPPQPGAPKANLNQQLQDAMKKRRGAVEVEPDSEDEGDSDDWK